MYIKTLNIYNFKNFNQKSIDLSYKINILIGDNGSGKSTILDAIHYLCIGKSYINYHDKFNIKYNSKKFSINGVFHNLQNTSQDEISCIYSSNNKTISRNGKIYKKISLHVGEYPCVTISPYDIDIINNSNYIRRKFIDNIICQADKKYIYNLINYNNILLQKNCLLKTKPNYNTLDIYNQLLSKYGTYIFESRQKIIPLLKKYLLKFYNIISGYNETIDLEYKSQIKKRCFNELLLNNLQNEILNKKSIIGIHKDDLIFKISGNALIKKNGSQGQQKSYTIALKLSQVQLLKNILNKNPILLLDDIFDKLDKNRVNQIINIVGNSSFGQVIISDTDRERGEYILNKVNNDKKLIIL